MNFNPTLLMGYNIKNQARVLSTISKQRRETYTGAFFLQSKKLKYFQKSLEEQETSVQSRS